MPRMKLYLNFERALTEAELAALRGLVKRRATREPLQHIIGSTSFCGLEIAVNRDVLIPRPETEQLAERAWRFLRRLSPEACRVLDFGTGSGCLAIAIAVHCPSATVVAVDLAEAALKVARQNAARQAIRFDCDQSALHPDRGYSQPAPGTPPSSSTARPPRPAPCPAIFSTL